MKYGKIITFVMSLKLNAGLPEQSISFVVGCNPISRLEA
jgi:hypothetical protein